MALRLFDLLKNTQQFRVYGIQIFVIILYTLMKFMIVYLLIQLDHANKITTVLFIPLATSFRILYLGDSND